jgi:acetyl/propionyl-CoA carboxylase alpha subunit
MNVTRKISKLLVANRGEIAARIFRTAKRLGINTVAVYSDADRYALHTRSADESIRIGAAEASASYLKVDSLVAAITASGATAVHPGYGFLSENGEFSEAVEGCGALFLGPTRVQMEALGDKEKAKELARSLKVPVLESEPVKPDTQPKLPFPLIIKARAGGGGRGMRIVRSAGEFSAAAASASREALSFFNDGAIFVERFIERARHVEVQLLGDGTGDVVAVGDRDCSVQRRHQKVLEEAPAFGLSEELRSKIHADAVKLLQSVGYRGAGTAEFLVCGEEYFFLEVNTRLQVEHPVTEAVTGLDLVELQIRIGEGERLKTLLPTTPRPCGAGIELRLCAENPHLGFAPATGTIAAVRSPDGVRLDVGFAALDTVSHHYDSLLGKIIVTGTSREAAIAAALRALAKPIVLGVDTNQQFLSAILSHSDFRAGEHFTRWLEQIPIPSPPPFKEAVYGAREDSAASSSVSCRLRDGLATSRRLAVELMDLNLREVTDTVELDGPPPPLELTGRDAFLVYRGWSYPVALRTPKLKQPKDAAGSASGKSGTILAPLPGKILDLKKGVGERVAAGETLVVLESMKMEHPVKSKVSGVLQKMCVASQQVVEAGSVLAEIAVD